MRLWARPCYDAFGIHITTWLRHAYNYTLSVTAISLQIIMRNDYALTSTLIVSSNAKPLRPKPKPKPSFGDMQVDGEIGEMGDAHSDTGVDRSGL